MTRRDRLKEYAPMAMRPTAGSPDPVIMATSSQSEDVPALTPETSNSPTLACRHLGPDRCARPPIPGPAPLVIDSVGIALATVVALLFRYDPITHGARSPRSSVASGAHANRRTVTDGVMGL